MSHRDFFDNKGEKWDVWLVLPAADDRRRTERRKALASGGVAYAGEDRRGRLPDRRITHSRPRTVAIGEFANGWLCFESETGEKRRLIPIPENWELLSRDELLKLRNAAKRVVRCGIR